MYHLVDISSIYEMYHLLDISSIRYIIYWICIYIYIYIHIHIAYIIYYWIYLIDKSFDISISYFDWNYLLDISISAIYSIQKMYKNALHVGQHHSSPRLFEQKIAPLGTPSSTFSPRRVPTRSTAR